MQLNEKQSVIKTGTGINVLNNAALRNAGFRYNRMPMSNSIASKYFRNDNKYYRPECHLM